MRTKMNKKTEKKLMAVPCIMMALFFTAVAVLCGDATGASLVGAATFTGLAVSCLTSKTEEA